MARRPRQHRFRRFVAPLIVVFAILVTVLFWVAWLPLHEAREAWLAGRDAHAIAVAKRWSQLHLWPHQYHQLLAVAYLTAGDSASAHEHLTAIGHPWISAVDKQDVARRLFARDRYADFLAYDAASQERQETADIPLYRAAAAAAINRLDDAERALHAINPAAVDRTKYAWLRTSIEQRRAGRVPYVLDRDGKTIAAYLPAWNDVIATDDDFAPLIDRDAGKLTVGAQLARIGPNQTIETTLDPFVQQAALAALTGYRGSLVAIDPRTNEILAIASARGKGAVANLAIENQYEPGSVIKVLTGLNAFSSGVNIESMFPYLCNGELMIDGRRFVDWLPGGHGRLATFDEALAVSCNVFFADIGLRLERERLEKFMISAGFNRTIDLGIIDAPLGRIFGDIFSRFETAFLAIGLQHESMNALHVAMIASMVANRGVMTVPRLVRQRRSILGEVVTGGPVSQTRLAPAAAAERIIQAMQAVAESPRGTGRRSAVEGISLAMKTGTAGERKSGLEALILAFAPVESPKIAFGVIAEDAGPAEFAGAKIAHAFLERMRPRL